MERVVVVVVGVLLVCWVTVVVVCGVGFIVLVVLSEKHDVSAKVSIKPQIPIMDGVFMTSRYAQEKYDARCGNA